MPGTEDGAPVCAARHRVRRATTGLAVAGLTPPRRRRARQGFRPRRRGVADARSADSSPALPVEAFALVVVPVSVHALLLGRFASPALRPG